MALRDAGHQARLSAVAHADPERLFRARPEYRGRCVWNQGLLTLPAQASATARVQTVMRRCP